MVTATNENSRNRLLEWASIPIILGCLVGGGLIIHWYLLTDPASHESKTGADPRMPAKLNLAQGAGVGQHPARNVRGTVKAIGNGTWAVHTDKASAELSVANGKATIGSVVYNSYSFVPPGVKTTITDARAIMYDNDRLAKLKLTEQQVGQLRALNDRITMNLSGEDKAQLCKAMLMYVQAGERDRAVMEMVLKQSLDDIAERATDATLQQAKERAAQINAIITPDLWKLNNSIGNGK